MSNVKLFKWLGIIILGLASLVFLGARVGVGGCDDQYPDAVTFDVYYFAGGKAIDIQFEADKDGAGSTGELTLYACTEQDAESCVLYAYDSDFDGVPDTSIVDGDSPGMRGLSAAGIAGFLRIKMSTASLTTEDPMLWVCAMES
jgi:hypothetical protein